jgi:hypothetical protein
MHSNSRASLTEERDTDKELKTSRKGSKRAITLVRGVIICGAPLSLL